ncbi:MAG: DinB family protein, partial [Planctomycetota bacterium]
MNSIDAINNNIQMAEMICGSYLDDLTDEEFMMRPHPGCNHVNWQVGHLISSDYNMFSGVFPGVLPDLPEGFSE